MLVTLDALLTEKNVTRAGLRMNLSQSAMSGGLARLRASVRDGPLSSAPAVGQTNIRELVEAELDGPGWKIVGLKYVRQDVQIRLVAQR